MLKRIFGSPSGGKGKDEMIEIQNQLKAKDEKICELEKKLEDQETSKKTEIENLELKIKNFENDKTKDKTKIKQNEEEIKKLKDEIEKKKKGVLGNIASKIKLKKKDKDENEEKKKEEKEPSDRIKYLKEMASTKNDGGIIE